MEAVLRFNNQSDYTKGMVDCLRELRSRMTYLKFKKLFPLGKEIPVGRDYHYRVIIMGILIEVKQSDNNYVELTDKL